MEQEALFRHLVSLASSVPDLVHDCNADETKLWLGRLHALVSATKNLADVVQLTTQIRYLSNDNLRQHAAGEIKTIMFRALANAEMAAPAAAQGAFIAAGNPFDAFAAVGKVLAAARRDILIVDPYMDATILTDLAPMAVEGVSLRLLADEGSVKNTLAPAVSRWTQQYGGTRPLAAKLAASRSLHDRSILLDGQTAWIATQSFKDLAARAPASISRLEGDAAPLKIAAYEEIWTKSRDI